jgi:hypothetical protein
MAKQKQQAEEPRADERRADEAPEKPEEAQDEEGQDEEEQEEPERLNHWEAAHRVVKAIDGDTTLSELAHDADQLVMAGGGRSNYDRSYSTVYSVLQSLQELGMLEMTEEVSVHPLHRLPSANGQK